MIRRLIILLLIVGCATEPEDTIKEVAWLIAMEREHCTFLAIPEEFFK